MSQRIPLPLDEPSHQHVGQDSSPVRSEGQERNPVLPTAAAPNQPLTSSEIDSLKEKIIALLHTCFDPEIPVNIYELGLIYDIAIDPTGAVRIPMTLTSPACPVAGTLPPDVQRKVAALPGVRTVQVDVVWEPPWDKGRMSEAAKLQLGIDD